ncbi:MAG: GTP-binding protein [Candidatus Altiarchaeales archaeon ex4484_96]|nr:MAG: GTP-binding protein [Candidatus Altiarchaeales archaeon ex4484_96]
MMADLADKIQEIEDEISTTPYNKATQHHIGKLKAKLAQLKEELTKKKSGGGAGGFGVKKEGDASIVLVGFPSCGKSTLLNKLTCAKSRTGSYEFTTLNVIPGVMQYKSSKIQILDLPGIIEGSYRGKGRGKEILSMVRTTDLVLILVDVNKPHQIAEIKKELYEAGLRLDCAKPNIRIKKTERGGVRVASSVELSKLDEKLIKDILSSFSIHSAEVTLHEDASVDELIDVVSDNRAYIPSITAVNKIDTMDRDKLIDLMKSLDRKVIPISATMETNLNVLRDEIYRKLGLIRLYMKPQGGEADLSEPLIVKKGVSVREVCRKIHRDFEKNFRYARIWGHSVKYSGQKKGLEHVLSDGDIISIIIKK